MTSDKQPEFMPGLRLSEYFYNEAVAPIMADSYPALRYSAGLIGSGSEVLGFDNEMSSDHHWGPRVMLFLDPRDLDEYRTAVWETLSYRLPRFCHGFPVSFTEPVEANGVQMLDWREDGPINHRVSFDSIHQFVQDYLGFDMHLPLSGLDWLSFPEQKLLAVTSGKLFRDDVGVEDMRRKFAYYPHDVWLYQLASCWMRIEQEGHLMGRAGIVGDEAGSALIAARLVRDCMRLSFLLERRYAPYPKWFGTAFKLLPGADVMYAQMQEVLAARSWQERQKHLSPVYEKLAQKQVSLKLTSTPLPTECSDFHGRPFMVISKGEISAALKAAINDPEVKAIADKRLIGGVDLFSDNTDFLEDKNRRQLIRALY